MITVPYGDGRIDVRPPDGFEVYSGEDKVTLPLLAIGAVGTIGVATHWTGPEHVQMFDAFEGGWSLGDSRRFHRAARGVAQSAAVEFVDAVGQRRSALNHRLEHRLE